MGAQDGGSKGGTGNGSGAVVGVAYSAALQSEAHDGRSNARENDEGLHDDFWSVVGADESVRELIETGWRCWRCDCE